MYVILFYYNLILTNNLLANATVVSLDPWQLVSRGVASLRVSPILNPSPYAPGDPSPRRSTLEDEVEPPELVIKV